MYQSELFRIKATSGQTISVGTLEAADTGYTYNIHTAIFLGTNSDASTVVMDGILVKINLIKKPPASGGFFILFVVCLM